MSTYRSSLGRVAASWVHRLSRPTQLVNIARAGDDLSPLQCSVVFPSSNLGLTPQAKYLPPLRGLPSETSGLVLIPAESVLGLVDNVVHGVPGLVGSVFDKILGFVSRALDRVSCPVGHVFGLVANVFGEILGLV